MIHKRLVILDNDDLKEMISRYINVDKKKLDIKVQFNDATGKIKFDVTYDDNSITFRIDSDQLIGVMENVNQLHKMEKGKIDIKR